MKTQKLSIFEHEDRKAGARYCSAPVADMDRRVVIAVFFISTDEWLAEISDLYGSQCSILRHHYLREYPVLLSGILSKEKIRNVRYFGFALLNFDRDPEGLRRRCPVQACSTHKNTPGSFAPAIELRPRWRSDLCAQPGFSHFPCLFYFKATNGGDPFAKKPGRT